MTLKGLGEMSEGYSAETCAGKIPLVQSGGVGPACADTGARTPIGASGIFVPKITVGFNLNNRLGKVYSNFDNLSN